MSCYKDFLEVVDAAKEMFYGTLAPNEERIEELETICDQMDEVAVSFGAPFIDVEMDETSGALILAIEVPEMTIKNRSDVFYELVGQSRSFGFQKLRGDMIRFFVLYDGIWVTI